MTRQISFCLCPGFPLFSIAAALDVMRHANRFAATEFYRWTFLSETDQAVTDSNGIPFSPGCDIATARASDFAFIVAGFDASKIMQPKLSGWLQKQARAGHIVGGISNGAFVLAAAGLLNQYSATTHWEDFESFCLLYPEVRARYQRFVMDRNRISCAGGSATLDLFLELARQDLGNEIALKISRQMLLQEQSIVLPGSTRRSSVRHYSPPVQRALSLIEAGVGQSIKVNELAQRIGISRRDLLRLFRKELNDTPSRILGQRRLDRARSLVLNTGLPMITIAESVGFSSQSHLTSSYHAEFGITPAQQRREYKAASHRLPLKSRDFRDW
ncbi:MAG: GlxA family transcriptional regulator [Gammaproteobacteria bacterium]|nr:GlxA family transcriptional regulator [Gammaproteobacteria bacterium]